MRIRLLQPSDAAAAAAITTAALTTITATTYSPATVAALAARYDAASWAEVAAAAAGVTSLIPSATATAIPTAATPAALATTPAALATTTSPAVAAASSGTGLHHAPVTIALAAEGDCAGVPLVGVVRITLPPPPHAVAPRIRRGAVSGNDRRRDRDRSSSDNRGGADPGGGGSGGDCDRGGDGGGDCDGSGTDNRRAVLSALFVHPDAGRRGVGTALVGAAEAAAAATGATAVTLLSSTTAEALYRRAGYAPDGPPLSASEPLGPAVPLAKALHRPRAATVVATGAGTGAPRAVEGEFSPVAT